MLPLVIMLSRINQKILLTVACCSKQIQGKQVKILHLKVIHLQSVNLQAVIYEIKSEGDAKLGQHSI